MFSISFGKKPKYEKGQSLPQSLISEAISDAIADIDDRLFDLELEVKRILEQSEDQ